MNPTMQDLMTRLQDSIQWLMAEKHGAQADAERYKNEVDKLQMALAEKDAEIARLKEALSGAEENRPLFSNEAVEFEISRLNRLLHDSTKIERQEN